MEQNNEVKFEEMSTLEQQTKLREIMQQIKQLEQLSGNSITFDINDISFFRLSNGEVAYDVLLNNPDGSTRHVFYQESNNTISPIDVDGMRTEISEARNQMVQYQGTGMDLTTINNQLAEKDEFINSLYTDDKVSLVELEAAQKECMTLAEFLGVSVEDVEYYLSLQGNTPLDLPNLSAEELQKIEDSLEIIDVNKDNVLDNIEIDKQKGIDVNAQAFQDSGIQSDEIKGDQKVTTNYSFNQIIGLNYSSYRIIKSKTGEPVVVGFKDDGTAERIPESTLELVHSENQSMSLIRDDGTIKNVGVMVAFRVKDPGSSIGRDQSIGLYSDNGNVNGFYARNASGERMIAEELPSRVYTSQRVRNENLMDTKYNNDIEAEAIEANERVEDGCLANESSLGNGNTNNMMVQQDIDELIAKYADQYDLDPDKVKNEYYEVLEDGHVGDKDNEQLLDELCEKMDREERHEPSPEHEHLPPM